jgi:hypothetical protein
MKNVINVTLRFGLANAPTSVMARCATVIADIEWKGQPASGLGQASPPRLRFAFRQDPSSAPCQIDGLAKHNVVRPVNVICDFAQRDPLMERALGAAVEIPHNFDAKSRNQHHRALLIREVPSASTCESGRSRDDFL